MIVLGRAFAPRCSTLRPSAGLGLAGLLVLALAASGRAAESRPKYGPGATRLSDAPAYLRGAEAPDFWALMPHYVPQRDGRSCSVASAAMVVNAVRGRRALRADDALVTQTALQDRVGDKPWKRNTGPGGKGVTLDELGPLLERSLRAYGVDVAETRVVHAPDPKDAAARAAFVGALREALRENERSSTDFIVVNYLQSVLTGDPEGDVGHIAPLAAYDAKSDRALVLDPDREWYEPYWVNTAVLADGMATVDPVAKIPRGYVRVRTTD